MFTNNFFRRTLPVVSLVLLVDLVIAQTGNTFNYAVKTSLPVAQWKTFVLSNATEIQLSAPPGKDQTARELAEVKKKMSEVDEKIRREIFYWDAGAPAYRWNEITNKLISFENINTYMRFPAAWVNVAIYDATLVAWKAKDQYNRRRPSQMDPTLATLVASPGTPSYPCEHTVAAAAAATVLAYFFPEKADSILALAKQAAQSRIYAGVQYPSDVSEGWKLGEKVAGKVIEQAKRDGADKPFTEAMPKEKNRWHGDHPVGINVRNYKPFVIRSADQFRPPPPPDFTSEMKEMKEFKQDFHSTLLALRWAGYTGFDIWTELASQKIFEYHLDRNTPLCTRIYTLLHVGMYDAGIAIMDAKYAYWGIRPNQYDTSYSPLIFTPPFPGYPSGHAMASSTAAAVLSYFFPSDKSFFKSTAQECADSRFYGGIHFRSDNETGLRQGEKLGAYVVETWAKK
ncbi:MAG TPA: phosphatase PAP2 family protein [Acidobacteriota bacterium]|jgi:membrane-associated phospholipid phosphatase